jgi:phosphatidylinositol alpha-mannosyltransferase
MAVYETVTHGIDDPRADHTGRVRADPADTRWTRLLRGTRRGGED